MSDPAAALQTAIIAALRADAAVAALVGARIFDRVPPPEAAPYPYIVLADVQILDDGTDCRDQAESFTDLHCYSDKVGAMEVKRIAAAVRDVLHEQTLDLDGHAMIDMRVRQTRYPRGDGVLSHAVLELRTLTEAV